MLAFHSSHLRPKKIITNSSGNCLSLLVSVARKSISDRHSEGNVAIATALIASAVTQVLQPGNVVVTIDFGLGSGLNFVATGFRSMV